MRRLHASMDGIGLLLGASDHSAAPQTLLMIALGNYFDTDGVWP